MTENEKSRCQTIIHGAAIIAAGGNLVPVPGVGIAADITVMTTMVMSLASIFGGNISEEVAMATAVSALKNTMLKQPIRVLTKELSKLIPGVGQLVAPSISVAMIEATGWSIANDLDAKRNKK